MRNSNWDIFGEVKATVSVPSAAEYYGVEVRNGMTTCIFHDDRTPSMKLYDDHFYCFGCTEHGDVVNFTARLFGLSQYEAAKKLCSDFGITRSRDSPVVTPKVKVLSEREKEQIVFRVLSDYCVLLRRFRTEFAPKSDSEEPHPLFIESLTQLEKYEHFCDIFISGSRDERIDFMVNCKEVIDYADRRNNEHSGDNITAAA